MTRVPCPEAERPITYAVGPPREGHLRVCGPIFTQKQKRVPDLDGPHLGEGGAGDRAAHVGGTEEQVGADVGAAASRRADLAGADCSICFVFAEGLEDLAGGHDALRGEGVADLAFRARAPAAGGVDGDGQGPPKEVLGGFASVKYVLAVGIVQVQGGSDLGAGGGETD
jgi:hypothetical protein